MPPHSPNPFFEEWGLIGALAGLLAVFAAPALWLYLRSPRDIAKYRLQVRAALTTVFKEAVIGESRAILRLVEDYMPFTLLPEGAGSHPLVERLVEAFGCEEAAEAEAEAEDEAEAAAEETDDDTDDGNDEKDGVEEAARGKLRGQVADALEAHLMARADRALERLADEAGDRRVQSEIGRYVPISFAARTEKRLLFVAQVTHRLDRKTAAVEAGKTYSLVMLCGTGVAVLGLLFSMLSPTPAAAIFALVFLLAFILCLAGTVIAAGLGAHAYRWLTRTAARYEAGELGSDLGDHIEGRQ